MELFFPRLDLIPRKQGVARNLCQTGSIAIRMISVSMFAMNQAYHNFKKTELMLQAIATVAQSGI